jgi:hypothetical protein
LLRSADVYEELKASALPNAHFAAAGIVAVNRAHERGYASQYIGCPDDRRDHVARATAR